MLMKSVPFVIAPRVILDLRDWYASHFTAPRVPAPPPRTDSDASIVHAIGTALFLADPTTPPDPNWPFAETVELVTQASASGIRTFHGRVRTGQGVLVSQSNRRLNSATKCRLTIRIRGFQPVILNNFEIPAPTTNPTLVPAIDLFPAVDYPFASGPRPPALLEGAVRRIDGTGMEGATITPRDPRTPPVSIPLFPIITGVDGRYLLIFNALAEQDGMTSVSQLDVELNHPEWSSSVVHTIALEPGIKPGRFLLPTRATLPTTVLCGQVQRAERPVPGAVVSLSSVDQPLITGNVRTNSFGEWQFYGDARLPVSGTANATVTVSVNGPSVTKVVPIGLGKRNTVPIITLP